MAKKGARRQGRGKAKSAELAARKGRGKTPPTGGPHPDRKKQGNKNAARGRWDSDS
jgi:hypothetical protein